MEVITCRPMSRSSAFKAFQTNIQTTAAVAARVEKVRCLLCTMSLSADDTVCVQQHSLRVTVCPNVVWLVSCICSSCSALWHVSWS